MLPFGGFSVFVTVTFSTVLCTPNSRISIEEEAFLQQVDTDAQVEKLLHTNQGIPTLAEIHTPVWIASHSDADKTVSYKQVDKWIVKRAIEYWKSNKFEGFNIRSRRSEVRNRNVANEGPPIRLLPPSIWANGKNYEKNRTKRESDDTQSTTRIPIVYRPSILVTMDYTEATWPTDKENEDKLIMERVLYALAFWNGVDLQLRHIRYPHVRLHLGGIIIGRNKEATPYVHENEGWITGLRTHDALTSMTNYWRGQRKNGINFPRSGYDIVATMTDSTPGWFSTIRGIPSGISSPGGYNCMNKCNLGIILFSDDLAFKGIQIAVREVAHVLGADYDDAFPNYLKKQDNVLANGLKSLGRTWSMNSLRQIATALDTNGKCYGSYINEAEKTVEVILPGKLLKASEQCQVHGWKDGYVCWKYLTCNKFYCANNHIFSRCTSIGAALDGTTCGTGMMCLDGKCVTNSTKF